jgi:hypothetical protein
MISCDRRIISVLPIVKLVQEGLLGCSSCWQVKLNLGSKVDLRSLPAVAEGSFVYNENLPFATELLCAMS